MPPEPAPEPSLLDPSPSPDPAPNPDPAPSPSPDPSPSPNGDFSFTSLIDDKGAFREGYANDLVAARPELEPFRETLAQYKDPIEALKALGNTKALVGRKLDSVEAVINANPDDPTAMGLKRQVLGIPDEGTPKAYEFEVPEEFKEVVSDDQLADFAKHAHELGLNRTQFSELVKYQAGLMGQLGTATVEQQAVAEQTARQQFLAEAEKQHGGKEGLDKALDQTVRLMRAGGMDDDAIREVGTKLHQLGPQFLSAMATLASNTAEDRLPAGGSAASQAVDAASEYRAIIHDKAHPKHAIYHDPNHPDHETVRGEVFNLIKRSKKKG